MGILDVIAKETNGIRQYSDQYQIRSNGSHTVHTVQDRPFTPESCPPLAYHLNSMLDSLMDFAAHESGDTIETFCELAYDRFTPREIFGYLVWHKHITDDDAQLRIIRILNDLMLEDYE